MNRVGLAQHKECPFLLNPEPVRLTTLALSKLGIEERPTFLFDILRRVFPSLVVIKNIELT